MGPAGIAIESVMKKARGRGREVASRAEDSMSQDVPPHSSTNGVEELERGRVETAQPQDPRNAAGGAVAFLGHDDLRALYLDRTCISRGGSCRSKMT